jgi:hypothetical protein
MVARDSADHQGTPRMHVTMLLAAAVATALFTARGAGASQARSTATFQLGQDKPEEAPPPDADKAQEPKPDEKPPEAPPSEAPPPEAPAPTPPAPDAQKPPDVPPEAPPTVPAGEKPPEVAPTPPGTGTETTAPAQPEPLAPGQEDVEAPTIAHTPVVHAPRGKALRVEAHVIDPSGVFQVVLFLRRHGGSDWIPLKMVADKIALGVYAVDLPTALMSTDLEYYIESYDNLGNGPARAGAPERPLPIKIDEPVVIVKPPDEEKKTIVLNRPKGAPPSITHSAVGKAYKAKPIELNARLKGETGVSAPTVKYRHLGESDFKTLPMGDIGSDNYTATIPSSEVNKDVEYYIEAFDKNGNGPGRSGGPEAPYLLRVEDEPPPNVKVVNIGGAGVTKRKDLPPPPFRPNPLRAGAYFALTAALGALTFAGGEGYAAWQANENYNHTYKYEGRNDADLLKRANDYGSRAKMFGIIGLSTAVVATVLLIVFPEHAELAPVGGSGGDAPVLLRF